MLLGILGALFVMFVLLPLGMVLVGLMVRWIAFVMRWVMLP